ncbi:MAG TPA: hypothetical protein VFG47_07975, partial [Geminicoccaceae bacterium]|nr:hypothetical protein [Geminicoccaceae bacterium]
QWAMTQTNLGIALQTLGAREERPDLFAEALAAVEGAFEVVMQAGLVQYEAYFRARIEELQSLIARTRRAG